VMRSQEFTHFATVSRFASGIMAAIASAAIRIRAELFSFLDGDVT